MACRVSRHPNLNLDRTPDPRVNPDRDFNQLFWALLCRQTALARSSRLGEEACGIGCCGGRTRRRDKGSARRETPRRGQTPQRRPAMASWCAQSGVPQPAAISGLLV